jgi:hypothetical protein
MNKNRPSTFLYKYGLYEDDRLILSLAGQKGSFEHCVWGKLEFNATEIASDYLKNSRKFQFSFPAFKQLIFKKTRHLPNWI